MEDFMKTVLAALLCTLGVVACGESRPAQTPTTTTSSTTETTAPLPASGMSPTTPSTMPGTATPSITPSTEPSTTTTTPGDLDTTGPRHDESMTGTAPSTTGAGAAAPSSDNPGAADKTKDATNTKINDRDRKGTATPTKQGGGNDRNITAEIRRSLVGDKTLSFTAKNVKIITVGGKVTLRGPVKSDDEKSAIEAKAKTANGVTEVDNQLEVKK
jgi:hyperosmotically inducible protein